MHALKMGYHFLKDRVLYGTLLYPYGILKHRALVKKVSRSQFHTYTCFYRSPGQLEALAGPVMEYLLKNRPNEKFLINIFACSNGAESYTFASILLKKFPQLDFQIHASDLHQEMVDRAMEATYSKEEVRGGFITEQFVSQTFDAIGDRYQVKPEIRSKVTFRQANLLDPNLGKELEAADIVLLQNVLCHLDREPAQEVFKKVVTFLKPKAVLFIDGMDLDMRETLTAEAKLSPLDFKCRQIHESARKHIGDRWWNYYYGIEPYASWRPNRLRRFSTIFFKEV